MSTLLLLLLLVAQVSLRRMLGPAHDAMSCIVVCGCMHALIVAECATTLASSQESISCERELNKTPTTTPTTTTIARLASRADHVSAAHSCGCLCLARDLSNCNAHAHTRRSAALPQLAKLLNYDRKPCATGRTHVRAFLNAAFCNRSLTTATRLRRAIPAQAAEHVLASLAL